MKNLILTAVATLVAGLVHAAESPKPVNLFPAYNFMPKSDLGKALSAPPPVSTQYPTIKKDANGDARGYIKKDLSVGGTFVPPSVNIQFPIP
jgi:hypothetical protein